MHPSISWLSIKICTIAFENNMGTLKYTVYECVYIQYGNKLSVKINETMFKSYNLNCEHLTFN